MAEFAHPQAWEHDQDVPTLAFHTPLSGTLSERHPNVSRQSVQAHGLMLMGVQASAVPSYSRDTVGWLGRTGAATLTVRVLLFGVDGR